MNLGDEVYLALDGWSGISYQRCRIVDETPKRFRIECVMPKMKLAGRTRWIKEGETALVPKHALRAEVPEENKENICEW